MRCSLCGVLPAEQRANEFIGFILITRTALSGAKYHCERPKSLLTEEEAMTVAARHSVGTFLNPR